MERWKRREMTPAAIKSAKWHTEAWNTGVDYTTQQQGIALHFFDHASIDWRGWHEYVIDLWEGFGLAPHRAYTHGPHYGYSSYTSTYKAAASKLEKFNYEKISACDFIVIKPEFVAAKNVSEYISEVSLRSGWALEADKEEKPDQFQEAYAYFLIDAALQSPEQDWLVELATNLQLYTGAKYGYHFSLPFEAGPNLFVGGSDRFSKTVEEYLRVTKWKEFLSDLYVSYLTPQEMRKPMALGHLRDIFTMNFLSQCHLDLVLDAQGTTLAQWIEADDERGSYWRLRDDFFCWQLEDEEQALEVRKALIPSGIIICS